MLQEICEYIHNYFVDTDSATKGEYTVSGGTFSPALLLTEGQRFLVSGSALNDGVYTYHAAGIKNDDDNAAAGLGAETFTGCITPMKVPKAVSGLSVEIANWITANADAINSPYTSESFGGYSYTKKSGADAHGNDALDWRSMFGKKLNRWRKIA